MKSNSRTNLFLKTISDCSRQWIGNFKYQYSTGCKWKIALVIFFSFSEIASAQKQNNEWRFGNRGISFNTNPPSQILVAALNTTEGSASVADKNTGALLFYTDGVTVWNAQNQVMLNGTGLLGGSPALLSSTTAAVIIPKPGSGNLYYIITVDEGASGSGTGGISYSVVDMSLEGGLGAVVLGEKNVFLFQTNSEKLEVVPAANGTDLWIVTQNGSDFVSFRVTTSGIQTTPVQSTVSGNLPNSAGHLKVNRQYNVMAMGSFFEAKLLLFNFNNATGEVSNRFAIPLNSTISAYSPLIYGVEFSPSGKFVYISNINSVFQYDISLGTQAAIEASAFLVDIGGQPASIQMGPDRKLYINNGALNVINCPDKPGNSCGFETGNLAGGGYGLPKWVYYPGDAFPPVVRTITVRDTCFENQARFSLSDTSGILSVSWLFGDPASGSGNTASGTAVTHNFTQPGNFNIRAIALTACGFDTLYLNALPIIPCFVPCTGTINAALDSCVQSPISFSLSSPNQVNSIKWNFDDPESGTANTSSSLLPLHLFSAPGSYNIRCIVNFGCGIDTLFKTIRVVDCSFLFSGQIKFEPDSCVESTTTFSITDNQKVTEAIWDFGDPASGSSNAATGLSQSHFFSGPGTYRIKCTVKVDCGSPPTPGNPVSVPCFFYDTLFKTITVIKCRQPVPECKIDLPNAFSPNADSKNDVFPGLPDCSFEEFKLQVFNRWGKMVFESSGKANQWDGRQGGNELSGGVYFFSLQYKLPSKDKQQLRGSVLLMR
jgi:gliding motility-associated-like protein